MSRFRVNQFRIYFLIVLLLAGIESSAFAALADEFTPALNPPVPTGAGPSSVITASFRNACSALNLAPAGTLTPLTDTALGAPSAATDGDTGNYWYSYQSCGGSNLNAFTLDLGTIKTIGSYIVYPLQTSGFTISTSDDNSSWTPRHTDSNTSSSGLVGPISIAVNGAYAARYIKYEGSNEASWCAFAGIADLQVFENCTSTAAQDLAVANFDGNSVSVMLGNGDGTFTEAAGSPIPLGDGTAPYAVISGNFNGDANIDLAVANSGKDTVSILFGNGDGTFTKSTESPYSVGMTPYALTSGDLDGDGKIDIAVANLKSGTVSILIGNGDGTFKIPSLSFPAENEPAAIVAADFNVDEVDEFDLPIVKDELAVADSRGQAVSILSLTKSGGTYTMTEPRTYKYKVGSTPLALVTGDFNGDGMPDLAAANANSKNISILIGMGTNLMANKVDYTVDEFPVSLTTADLNGDGKLDLAATHLSDNTVSVLYGNSDGKFQDPLTFDVGRDPIAVTAGDFNADGRNDLMTANYKDNTLSLLINTLDLVLNVTSPAGGEKIQTGPAPHLITWDAFPGAVSYQIYRSEDNGVKFKKVAKVGNVTSYNWTVPLPKMPNMNDNLIKIVGYNASNRVIAEGRSKSTFAVVAVNIVSPNGGEVLTEGTTVPIVWSTYATKKAPTSVKLYISKYDNSEVLTWTSIDTITGNPGSYLWTVPTVDATQHNYLVKIELRDDSSVLATDISDRYFTIKKP